MTHVLEKEALAADDVLLVPRMGILNSRSQAELGNFIYSAPMDTVTGYELTKSLRAAGHTPVVCRNLPVDEFDACLLEYAEDPDVFFAVSMDKQWLLDFVKKLDKINLRSPINLALDVAHGYSVQALDTGAWLRSQGFVNKLMSGSVCTPTGALSAIQSGFTHLRVGIGPGAVCTTRIQTGCGYPQLSAVYKISQVLKEENTHAEIIADGGIKSPGDAVKYLAAGATGIMMGSVFSRTIESRGWEFGGYKPLDEIPGEAVSFPRPSPDPRFVKRYRGHASAEFQRDHLKSGLHIEGVSTDFFEYGGATVESTVQQYEAGVASAISYLGLRNIRDLSPDKVMMVRITNSAVKEGQPHGQNN